MTNEVDPYRQSMWKNVVQNGKSYVACPFNDAHGMVLRKNIKKHINSKACQNYRMYQCGACSKNYCNKRPLMEHIKNKHSDGPVVKPFKCELCHKCYTRKESVRRHKRTVHRQNV